MTPEAKARTTIDALLAKASWHVCGMADGNIHAAQGVAIRKLPLNIGFGFADYMPYVNGKACGVIEAKKEGGNAQWRRSAAARDRVAREKGEELLAHGLTRVTDLVNQLYALLLMRLPDVDTSNAQNGH